jgi:plastocyanin
MSPIAAPRRRPGSLPALLAVCLLALSCGDPKSPTDPSGGPQEHVILVADFQFTPARLTVHPGDTVTWRNMGGFHNVVAADGSFRCSEGCDGAGGDGAPSSSAWRFSRTFTTPGEVAYFCWVHGGPGGAGMSGEIVVSER